MSFVGIHLNTLDLYGTIPIDKDEASGIYVTHN